MHLSAFSRAFIRKDENICFFCYTCTEHITLLFFIWNVTKKKRRKNWNYQVRKYTSYAKIKLKQIIKEFKRKWVDSIFWFEIFKHKMYWKRKKERVKEKWKTQQICIGLALLQHIILHYITQSNGIHLKW